MRGTFNFESNSGTNRLGQSPNLRVLDKIFFYLEAYYTYGDKEKNILTKKLAKIGSSIVLEVLVWHGV